MRTGQVWPDVQEETTSAGPFPSVESEVVETAEVADASPEGIPPPDGVPPVSPPALLRSVGEKERGGVLPVTTSLLRRARETTLLDAARRPELPVSLTVVGADGADESEAAPVYLWQPGLVLSLAMLGCLVTGHRERP